MTASEVQQLTSSDGWHFSTPSPTLSAISAIPEAHLWRRTLSAEEITDISNKMARGEMGDCDCAICTGEVKLV